MKILLRSLLLLFILSSVGCRSNLFNKLQGGWLCIEDMDCPDFILFHKSGRYVVLNDCGSQHPWIPVVEKGDWTIRNNKELALMNREFVSGGYANFIDVYGEKSSLLFSIKYISDKELHLNFDKNGVKYTDHYQKQERSSVMMQYFSDRGSSIKKLTKPTYRGLLLLKLKYKLFYPGAAESGPSELIVQDQDGHELWRKAITFKQNNEMEEILLADRLEIINLTEFIFEIKTQQNVTWELKAKLY